MRNLITKLFGDWRLIPYSKLPSRPVVTAPLQMFNNRSSSNGIHN